MPSFSGPGGGTSLPFCGMSSDRIRRWSRMCAGIDKKCDSSGTGISASLRGRGCLMEKVGLSHAAALWVNEFEFHFPRCHKGALNLWECWLKPNLNPRKTGPKASVGDFDGKIHYSSQGDVIFYLVLWKRAVGIWGTVGTFCEILLLAIKPLVKGKKIISIFAPVCV